MVRELFAADAKLHQTVYTHAKVEAAELMVVDALLKANDHLQIASKIVDVAEFWKLNDTIMNTIETDPDPALEEARELILLIKRRDFYELCIESTVSEHFGEVTAADIIGAQVPGKVILQEDDVAVSNIKIDLTRGMNKPLGRSSMMRAWNVPESTFNRENISKLLPPSPDRIVRVYSKKPHLANQVSDAFLKFEQQRK